MSAEKTSLRLSSPVSGVEKKKYPQITKITVKVSTVPRCNFTFDDFGTFDFGDSQDTGATGASKLARLAAVASIAKLEGEVKVKDAQLAALRAKFDNYKRAYSATKWRRFVPDERALDRALKAAQVEKDAQFERVLATVRRALELVLH